MLKAGWYSYDELKAAGLTDNDMWDKLNPQTVLNIGGYKVTVTGRTQSAFSAVPYNSTQPTMYSLEYLKKNAKIVSYFVSA